MVAKIVSEKTIIITFILDVIILFISVCLYIYISQLLSLLLIMFNSFMHKKIIKYIKDQKIYKHVVIGLNLVLTNICYIFLIYKIIEISNYDK